MMYDELVKRLRERSVFLLPHHGESRSYDADLMHHAADAIEALADRNVGKWEQVDDYRYPWGCTNCHNTFSGRHNFCPNCGAMMEES